MCLDNNSSPHGQFRRFLFPFSGKFPDLKFTSYVLYIYLCGTHSEPALPNWIALADISLANGAELNLILTKSARPLYFSFLSLSGVFGTGINKYC